MRIVNLMGRDVALAVNEGGTYTNSIVFHTESRARAKVEIIRTNHGDIDGIQVKNVYRRKVVDLPAVENGTLYLVSDNVRMAVPDRTDVYTPMQFDIGDKSDTAYRLRTYRSDVYHYLLSNLND